MSPNLFLEGHCWELTVSFCLPFSVDTAGHHPPIRFLLNRSACLSLVICLGLQFLDLFTGRGMALKLKSIVPVKERWQHISYHIIA